MMDKFLYSFVALSSSWMICLPNHWEQLHLNIRENLGVDSVEDIIPVEIKGVCSE